MADSENNLVDVESLIAPSKEVDVDSLIKKKSGGEDSLTPSEQPNTSGLETPSTKYKYSWTGGVKDTDPNSDIPTPVTNPPLGQLMPEGYGETKRIPTAKEVEDKGGEPGIKNYISSATRKASEHLGKFIEEGVQGTGEGVKTAKEGVKMMNTAARQELLPSGLIKPTEEDIDNIGKEHPENLALKGFVKTLAGSSTAAMSILTHATPTGIGFTEATKGLEEIAPKSKDLTKFLFAPITSSVEYATGEELTGTPKDFASVFDLASSLLLLHGAKVGGGEAYKKYIADEPLTAKDFNEAAKSAMEGFKNPEELKKILDEKGLKLKDPDLIANQQGFTPVTGIKTAQELDATPSTPSEAVGETSVEPKTTGESVNPSVVASETESVAKPENVPDENASAEASPMKTEESPEGELNKEKNINFAKDEIPQQVPSGEHGEEAKSNSRNEEIALQLRGRIEEAHKDAGVSEGDGKDLREIDNKVAHDFAKETNTWIGNFDSLGERYPGGNEHTIAFNEDQGKLYKSNNLSNTISLNKFFDKIKLHNELFPDTKYEFKGFAGVENMGRGKPYVEPVYSQDFIKDAEPATLDEISDYMKNLGFEKTGDFKYKKDGIEVSDVRPRNVMKDKDGNIYVIDAEFKETKRESTKSTNPPTPPASSTRELGELSENEPKKSLINRVYEGKTPEEIKGAVEKHGLNYNVETHPQAERLASNFVKEVGIDNAIEAVRANQVEGGAAPFVWATAIDAVHKEFLSEKNPEARMKLAEKEAELIDEFDKKARSGGRFSSALQAVYQVSDLGYKLGTILNRAKEANNGEAVSEILKTRLSDLSAKLDDVNKRISEREKVVEQDVDTKIAEEVDKVIKNIYEKLPTERRKKADKAIKALEGIQSKLRAKTYDATLGIPVAIIDTGISLIKNAIRAGVHIADAVEIGINHIKERYGKDWEKENEFREDVLDAFKEQNIDLKRELTDKDKLEKYKAALTRSKENYQKKLLEKDFTPKKRSEKPALDKEGFELLVEKNKLKDEVDLEIERLKLKNRTLTEKVENGFIDIINLPKSLMASADMSAPLRQGAILSIKHPILASKTMVEMFRQAFSEKKAIDWLARLKSSPEYAIIKEAGLYLSEPSSKLSAKEEQFISNIAHKIPIWGKVVRGSERAYSGYLNKLRADVFSQFHDGLLEQGISGDKLKVELESFADFVNNASGRGNLGRFEDSAAGLNAFFFSPRYAVSRFNLINPYQYVKMAPKARVEALKTMAVYIGIGSTVLALAKAGGANVNLDPRASDFGKIRIGNTRFDIWSGFQQWVRLISQVATGERADVKGNIKELGSGYKSDTRLDLVGRFLRYKSSPVVGESINILAGKDAIGQPVSFKFKDMKSFMNTEEGRLILPLYMKDLIDAAKLNGVGVPVAGALGSFFGVGVQTYDENAKNKKLPSIK